MKKKITEEEAKKIAAGPLGKEMARFPMLFATAVFWGSKTNTGTLKVINGTMSLVNLGNKQLGITCEHVFTSYLDAKKKDKRVLFHINGAPFEPTLIDENKTLDLSVIDLDHLKLKNTGIGSSFFQAPSWPPEEVKVGDFIAFGGFPGVWKEYPSVKEVVFNALCHGSCEVIGVTDRDIICSLDAKNWVITENAHARKNVGDYRGLSGGPAFLIKQDPLIRHIFVGIVYQHGEMLDTLHIRKAKFISPDGKIST